MSLIIDESFEYRHKKFDVAKRSRTESSSSDSDDYECKQQEIEKLNERLQEQQHHRLEDETLSPPPFKRQRTSSSSDSSYSNAYSPIPFTNPRSTSTPFKPLDVSIPPAAAILPKISDETLRSICKYHGNMVRKYPKKERTPKDQERRDKNTLACRMSRRVKKLEHVAVEEQYKEFSQQTFGIIEQAMRSTAYLHKLMELSKEMVTNEIDVGSLEEEKSAVAEQDKKKSFTIDYLIGNRE